MAEPQSEPQPEQQPLTNGHTHSDDTPTALSLMLKHGIHTILLFASPQWTFSRLSSELLSVLRERYPDGLTTALEPRKTTPIPASIDEKTIVYGIIKDREDPSQGWDEIVVENPDQNKLGQKGFVNETVYAFAFADKDFNPRMDDIEFEVEFPPDDEAEEEERHRQRRQQQRELHEWELERIRREEEDGVRQEDARLETQRERQRQRRRRHGLDEDE
ncbi:hypothetical protein QBC38DRAFT_398827 [Podospora fimiseda]|uniref:Uncharacterized protein n=1 Tax=Podospora fimiseda TaxID=252190 RepID=A0AAN7BI82_9PEZI|nr:hypothetical protein QBC38DRAFT_398827 [Podospora fimiseda]